MKLIAGVDHLSDVDTVTTPPRTGDSLTWDAVGLQWVPGVPITSGISPKDPVRAATTQQIALDGTVDVVDSVGVGTGDRILVMNQTLPAENGIYDVTLGAPWTRSADAVNEGDIITGTAVFVELGTLYGGINFIATILIPEAPWTPGTDASYWTVFSSELDIQAGAGMVLNAKTIDVVALPDSGITVNADDIAVDRTVTDQWYGIVSATEPAAWEVWIDIGVVEPIS